MSAELLNQLAEYGRHVRAERRPVDLSDIRAAADTARDLGEPAAPLPDDTTELEPDEGDLIMVDIQTREAETTPTGGTSPRRWARWAILAAAAVIVVIVAVALFDGTEETGIRVVDDPTPDLVVPEFGPEAALAVADEYFAANSAGDFDALRALFTPDATFTGPFHIGEDEMTFVWNAAQGTEISERDCTVTGEPSSQSVTVKCTFFNLDVLVQAVDGPPVPIALYLTVTPDGISDEAGNFGPPDFNAVGDPFDRWMRENHPDDIERVGFADWASVEEAEAGGTLRAQFAQEWADQLEANGCTFEDVEFIDVIRGADC